MKIGIFATHPVQYQVPLWRRLNREPGLEVKVFYFSDHSVRGGIDADFGVPVAWDTPLLEGYVHDFIDRYGDISKPYSIRIRNASALLQREMFDWILVQGYTHGFEWQIRRHARRFGSRIVLRGEFTDMPRRCPGPRSVIRNGMLRWFYRGIDSFCYIGEQARRHFEIRGFSSERLHFSPYCVDDSVMERQYGMLDREECRKELGVEPDHFVFLFSGKFIPRKQPLLLADAVRRVSDREKVAVILLGDGLLKSKVESDFRSLLGERLLMPGFVNQSLLGRYFRAADTFVLPSTYETWGLVVNEAMQFGLPVVISSKVGCKDDLVIPGTTGFVFPTGDARALAETMELLIRDRDRARRIGISAREHVRGYNIERAAQGILDAIGACVQAKAQPMPLQ